MIGTHQFSERCGLTWDRVVGIVAFDIWVWKIRVYGLESLCYNLCIRVYTWLTCLNILLRVGVPPLVPLSI